MNLYTPYLTIGELARRTGVGVSTLRAWEQRYGFPVPQRLASGHRRYSPGDEDAVRQVVHDRLSGMTLEAAIGRIAHPTVAAPTHSLLATMHRMRPDLPTRPLSRATMLAISNAIEDEAAGRAHDAVLIGAFQRPEAFSRARRRWTDLARSARATVVLASFGRPVRRAAYWEVPVDERAPLAREWAVLCDAPGFGAVMVGRELPAAPRPGHGRRDPAFEAAWSVEPDVVREVARTAVTIASAHMPDIVEATRARLGHPPVITHDVVRTMTRLTNRIVGELDRSVARSSVRPPGRPDARAGRPPLP